MKSNHDSGREKVIKIYYSFLRFERHYTESYSDKIFVLLILGRRYSFNWRLFKIHYVNVVIYFSMEISICLNFDVHRVLEACLRLERRCSVVRFSGKSGEFPIQLSEFGKFTLIKIPLYTRSSGNERRYLLVYLEKNISLIVRDVIQHCEILNSLCLYSF